ncbi:MULTISPECIES: alpha/beta hydrolase [Pseudomonas]|uniref:alpha/beta hydrolase n=1 Tax=Pseudomonas TaxID=286 RepID=UPI000CD5C634|nr:MULTISPECIES: alpha/beta hydrolase [Pseudomonas]RBH53703.1 alpha/beta hydrolase [Pseudomonas sp. MWU13-2860]
MEAEKIILPSGKTASLAATHTLTVVNDTTIKSVPVAEKKAIVFFIGGAGDQESYYFQGAFHNIDNARNILDNKISAMKLLSKKYTSWPKSYNDARGSSNIQNNFIANIPSKSCPIYIVGHSLGGWNGAHLSRILSEAGYTVKFLVTLDPVGEGFWVWVGSDIYKSEASPIAETWINIRANSSKPDSSDGVAKFGGRWIITDGPTMNKTMDVHHASADWMFIEPVQGTKSACDLIFDSINGIFGQ